MALPPLELFSLRKELPCCRAALSVSEHISNQDAGARSSTGSDHSFPQLSHSQELVGSAARSTGSAAPQRGQTGGSYSGISSREWSRMSWGIGFAMTARA